MRVHERQTALITSECAPFSNLLRARLPRRRRRATVDIPALPVVHATAVADSGGGGGGMGAPFDLWLGMLVRRRLFATTPLCKWP